MSSTSSSLHQCSVMIVDDDPLSRRFIEKALNERGLHVIHEAESGTQAIEQLERNVHVDLIILDIVMPGFSGIDCCKWIREQPQFHGLPVLMLTSLTDQRMRLQSYDAGANDFISKPLHPEELYARVRVQLENRLAMKDLQHYRLRLSRELACARELQAGILPSNEEIQDLQHCCKLEIASHLSSSSEIGGDFWGVKRLFPHQTALWTVDFSGHGVAAALNTFRLQAYLKIHSEHAFRPGEYLSHLNEKLLHLLLRGYFATMFYGIVDTQGNQLLYACACTPHPLIVRQNGKIEIIDGTETPLGICLQFYQTHTIEFKAGDTLVLYSDAYIETPDIYGNHIIQEEIQDLLSNHTGKSANDFKTILLDYFNKHISAPASDDLGIIVVQRTG